MKKNLEAIAKRSGQEEERLGSVSDHFEGLFDVISRVTGAVARAFFVVLLIATPSLLLPGQSQDTTQIVVLIAFFAALITLIEYSSSYPALIEFRNAPPLNRIRFITLFLIVFFLSIVFRGLSDPTTLTQFITVVGLLVGHVIDFPYSPVRLVIYLMPEDVSPDHLSLVRASAGISYLVALVSLAVFMIVIRVSQWPNQAERFNFWTNLPTFDPTMGGDIVTRLNRDARFNITLGFLLPFLTPLIVKTASGFFDTSMSQAPQTLVWMIAVWTFLPASLFMRGIAMNRIAEMIEHYRTRGAGAIQPSLARA
ncbi:hypothetical protein [Litoreibacter roseus]|uniref:Membrane protein n=1 Tax=Litoreibacter roseus TaxID=2601869 RepID=A0A6N6JFT5_9RHOB|nr:hypothetical protein [Litoreibacter roseus]GFE64650.1 membrane protein [Litoreibacter roseus]